jgi:uncharacterized membrane protein
MRKLFLITAMVLASAAARAGDNRGLTQASNEEKATVAQPAAVEAPTAEAPKYVDRPAAVNSAAEPAKPDMTKPLAVQTPRGEKPSHRRYWTEARIIGELHRHGIYW